MKTPFPYPNRRRLSETATRRAAARGFSLVESLMAVAALGILGGVGYLAFHEVDDGARSAKIRSDVSVLNEAVTMYVASGGSLKTADTTEKVLAKLKTKMSAEDAARHMSAGTGSFIDHRLEAEMQTVKEAATTQPRAVWNSAEQRFDVKNSGVIGVKRFRLNQALANAPVITETRDGTFATPSGTGGWLWDHQNTPGSHGDGHTAPTLIVTEAFPTNPEPTTGPAAINSAIVQEGGKDVTITGDRYTDPNGAVTDVIVEAGDGVDGVIAPVVRKPDGKKPKEVDPERLQTPAIYPPGTGYLHEDFPLAVSVVNARSYASLGKIKHRVDGDSWTDYSGPVTIGSDTRLEFKVEPLDTDTYKDSLTTYDYYYGVSDLFSGSSVVQFKEIGGKENLYFFLSQENTFLTHGNPFKAKNKSQPDVLVLAGEANTMKVMSVSFSDVLPGYPFKIGEVLYHNGTTFDDSHADKATILFDITFTAPDAVTDLKIPLELINTDNRGGPDASADVVRIKDPTKTFELEIDGRKFLFIAEFVAIDEEGFSDGRSFHVYEGRTARAELRGTIFLKDY